MPAEPVAFSVSKMGHSIGLTGGAMGDAAVGVGSHEEAPSKTSGMVERSSPWQHRQRATALTMTLEV